jgi:hypothetical protein
MTQPTPHVLDAVRDAADEGRITCARLRALAEELDVPYSMAGQAADDLGVRVKQCDLGCF